MEKQFKTFPRGLEVLVKKAAVDPEFRVILLEQRAAAAGEIELSLSPVEAAMLAAIPRAQLELIIDQTEVPAESRRVFLGKVAAAMLAALGLGAIEGCVSWTAHGHRVSTNQVIGQGIEPGPPERILGAMHGTRPEFIPLGDPIYFDYDQSQLRLDQFPVVDRNLKLLEKYVQQGRTVRLSGHADERGTEEYNFFLGQRRALAVRDYLVQSGIPTERIQTISYGKERPFDPAHTEAAWTKNRRVEFEVTD